MDTATIFKTMPSRYKKGSATKPITFYFSIGEHKYTVKIDADQAVVEPGKTIDNADVVLKATPELFVKMVVDGKMPGMLDIAAGRIKTNDVSGLQKLKAMFDFG